jgi:glutamate synthase domain-containing protein 1
MASIDTNPNQNNLDKKPNPAETYQGEQNKDALKKEFLSYSKWEDKEAREIDKVVRDIVALKIPISELGEVINTLPLAKRLEVQKIFAAQEAARDQNIIATSGQKEYQQYLQSTFFKDTSNKAWEMVQSIMKNVWEMYQKTQAEIQKMTAWENPSEIAKKEFKMKNWKIPMNCKVISLSGWKRCLKQKIKN